MENQRNPTQFNQDLLRAWFKDYFTGKAADFNKRFDEGKYQAAAYILDGICNVWDFGEKNGALGHDEAVWLWGGENGMGLIDHHKEAVCRARVDGETVQEEVERRFQNVMTNTRQTIRMRCDNETVNKVLPIMADIQAKFERAGENMRSPRR